MPRGPDQTPICDEFGVKAPVTWTYQRLTFASRSLPISASEEASKTFASCGKANRSVASCGVRLEWTLTHEIPLAFAYVWPGPKTGVPAAAHMKQTHLTLSCIKLPIWLIWIWMEDGTMLFLCMLCTALYCWLIKTNSKKEVVFFCDNFWCFFFRRECQRSTGQMRLRAKYQQIYINDKLLQRELLPELEQSEFRTGGGSDGNMLQEGLSVIQGHTRPAGGCKLQCGWFTSQKHSSWLTSQQEYRFISLSRRHRA